MGADGKCPWQMPTLSTPPRVGDALLKGSGPQSADECDSVQKGPKINEPDMDDTESHDCGMLPERELGLDVVLCGEQVIPSPCWSLARVLAPHV